MGASGHGPTPNRAERQNPQGEKLGILTGILYLAPANESGVMKHMRIVDAGMPKCVPLYRRPWEVRSRAQGPHPKDTMAGPGP